MGGSNTGSKKHPVYIAYYGFFGWKQKVHLEKNTHAPKKTKKGTSREENISPGYSSHGWEWDVSMSFQCLGGRNSCMVHFPLTGRFFFHLKLDSRSKNKINNNNNNNNNNK